MLTATYMKKNSTYVLAKFKQLKDLPTTYRNARVPISLIFFIWHLDKDKVIILNTFEASNALVYTKLRKYQELEYREQPLDLRMEFYLHIFYLCRLSRDIIYNVFSGTKILYAGLVSHGL